MRSLQVDGKNCKVQITIMDGDYCIDDQKLRAGHVGTRIQVFYC